MPQAARVDGRQPERVDIKIILHRGRSARVALRDAASQRSCCEVDDEVEEESEAAACCKAAHDVINAYGVGRIFVHLNPKASNKLKDIVAHLQKRWPVLQALSLRDGKAFDDPTVVGLAQKHGRSAAQILGRWCVQKGFIYIPKSVKRERMADNMAVFDFELAADDVAALDALTTPAAIEKFKELYVKCVVRDTPDAGRAAELAREKVTLD